MSDQSSADQQQVINMEQLKQDIDGIITLSTDCSSGDEGSFSSAEQEGGRGPIMTMHEFPNDAKIGSKEAYHQNCFSQPEHTLFNVRGSKYLIKGKNGSKKKVSSGPFVFPQRGVELFLTKNAPENVSSNPNVLDGHLRDVPTFVMNWRLPFGVLVMYYEIPERFVPYMVAGNDPEGDHSDLVSQIDSMSSNTDRAVCRFLMGDKQHKDSTLKLIPRVVDGPWIVKNTVPSKPAIIGTKLPVSYFYDTSSGSQQQPYLEVDFDIASSAAARGILNVCRKYTKTITVDLGFVIQGNTDDELPEQMLVASRLHCINPLASPPLP